jgi:hypothetical protein
MVFAEINTFGNQKNWEGEQAVLPTIILQLKTILCNNIFLLKRRCFKFLGGGPLFAGKFLFRRASIPREY